MTTNQTIDGVPRELLAQWLAMFEGGIASSPLSALRELTRKYLQTEQAAQPQGEPVAWQYRVSAGPQTGWSLWHDGKGEELKQSYQVETRPLYAEQPAPVAVVLPDPDQLCDIFDSNKGADGTLVISKKLAEQILNPSRPHHANPPPDTEPSGTHHDNDGLDEWRKP